MKKKILAALTAMALAATAMPLAALADDADTAAEEEAVVVLLDEGTEDFSYDYDSDGDDIYDSWDISGTDSTVYAYLTENGTEGDITYTLTVEGTGATEDFKSSDYASANAGWSAFVESITKIEIGDGVTYIGNYAFGAMTVVTELSIGSGLESFGNWAFIQMSSLVDIDVDSANTVFKTGTDGALRSLDGTIIYVYPQGTIAENTAYTVPDEVTTIWKGAFRGASNITSLDLNNVTTIQDQGFLRTGITTIEVPGTVTSVGSGAFRCPNLETAYYNASCTLPTQTFYGCTNLKTVTVGSNVTGTGQSVFGGCSALETVYFDGAAASQGLFNGCTGSVKLYIGADCTSIAGNFAEGYTCLTDLVFEDGDSNVDVDFDAFYNCTSLTTLSDEYNRIKTIGNNAFRGTGLSGELKIGSGVTSIGQAAFMGTAITSLDIVGSDDGIVLESEEDNHGPFAGLTTLKTVKLGANITSIGRGSFNGCTNIIAVDMTKASDLQTIAWRYSFLDMADGSIIYAHDSELAELLASVGSTSGTDAYDKTKTVVAVTDGGTVDVTRSDTEASVLMTPTRSGYIFKGWYTDEEYETAAVLGEGNTVTIGTTYYAKWEKDTDTESTDLTMTASDDYEYSVNTIADDETVMNIGMEYGTTATGTVVYGGGSDIKSVYYDSDYVSSASFDTKISLSSLEEEADGNENQSSNTVSFTPNTGLARGEYLIMQIELDNGATYAVYLTVGMAITPNITVEFESTGTNGQYYIKLASDAIDYYINRFTAAQLAFTIDNDDIAYTITPSSGINLTTAAAENNIGEEITVYGFNLNDATMSDSNALENYTTDGEIIIGTVDFVGVGELNFGIDGNYNDNMVQTTTVSDNIVVTYYVDNGDNNLIIDNTVNAVLSLEETKLTINVMFPNTADNQVSAYEDMTVTIDNLAGGNETIYLGSDGTSTRTGTTITYVKPGTLYDYYGYVVETSVYKNYASKLTFEGAGYRTYRTSITPTSSAAVVTVWNNAMDSLTQITTGCDGDADATAKVTFLAGDICQNGVIDLYDLSAVVSYFGKTGMAGDPDTYASDIQYDLNRDGKIDSKDIAMVLVSWGK